jgi:hypothetical protein
VSIARHPVPFVPRPPIDGCAFPDARRATSLCGREPVAVYLSPDSPALATFRCDRHDLTVAAEMGFRRVALDTKAARVAALDRRWARGES